MIQKLNNWIVFNSNGDWEHDNGVKIYTTDIPGWGIEIDLTDTVLENAMYEYNFIEEDEFIEIYIKNRVFIAYCSINNLIKCINIFFEEVFSQKKENFLYEVYMPIKSNSIIFYRPLLGLMTNDFKIKITQIPAFDLKFITTESIDNLVVSDLSNLKDINQSDVFNKVYDVKLKKLHLGNCLVITNYTLVE